MSDFIAIPAITVLCYLGGEIFKAFAGERSYKHIPVLCGVCGAALGLLCHFCAAGLIPADNPLTAAAVGVVSGWAATGANQSWKQEKEEQ